MLLAALALTPELVKVDSEIVKLGFVAQVELNLVLLAARADVSFDALWHRRLEGLFIKNEELGGTFASHTSLSFLRELEKSSDF